MFYKNKIKNQTEKPTENIKRKKHVIYVFRVLFTIIFIILLYVILNFVKLFNKNEVKIYEVNTGEIVNVDRHKGFIYRNESVVKCANEGYINFYVANADRIKKGSFVYTINDSESLINTYELNLDDKKKIKRNIKMFCDNISDLDFSNLYVARDELNELINEINIVKQFEDIDIEKEINAKEKGYAKYAGLVSFLVDGYEDSNFLDFNSDLIKKNDIVKVNSQKKKVESNDKIYKIVKSPEFSVAFDSEYDYDNYNSSNSLLVKFVYENVTTNGRIESFIGNDNKKHFLLTITEYPEKFIDKRVVDFEIINKKVSGFKIPIKSIIQKNCFIIPKNMVEKDSETDENIIYKYGQDGNKIKIQCNVSKEDENYCYISINDSLSKVKYGDVITNKYNDNYSLSEVVKLEGVYNMNKGYAVFKNIDVIDRTNEYAIIKRNSQNSVAIYDHLALNASEINEGDLIS